MPPKGNCGVYGLVRTLYHFPQPFVMWNWNSHSNIFAKDISTVLKSLHHLENTLNMCHSSRYVFLSKKYTSTDK